MCGSGDILADRQTDTHTQTYSSQYFATVPAGEVNINLHTAVGLLRINANSNAAGRRGEK